MKTHFIIKQISLALILLLTGTVLLAQEKESDEAKQQAAMEVLCLWYKRATSTASQELHPRWKRAPGRSYSPVWQLSFRITHLREQ